MNEVVQTMIEKVATVEAALLTIPQANIVTVHHFAPGLYAREIRIPAGVMLTGIIHRHDDLACVSDGDISVLHPGGWQRIRAPYTGIARAGFKRLGYAHADTVYTTFHSTTLTDIEELEAALFDSGTGPQTNEHNRVKRDRVDFVRVVAELGLTQDQVQVISENNTDLMTLGDTEVEVRPSAIHGLGMFAKVDFAKGGEVTLASVAGKRTEAGRYMNHSADPNLVGVRLDNGIVGLLALRDIRAGEELTVDYKLSRTEGAKL